MLSWRDPVDDDQLAAATWAWQREGAGRLTGLVDVVVMSATLIWFYGPEQLPDPGDIGGTVAVSVEAVMADAVLASGEHVDQEAADELGRGQRHGGVAGRAFAAIILDAEGNTALIETD